MEGVIIHVKEFIFDSEMPYSLSTSAADFLYHKCLQLHFILHHSADKVGCREGTLVDHPWNWILFNYNFIYFSPNCNFIFPQYCIINVI